MRIRNRCTVSDAQYNTNLAAEFHVLSILHRLGRDATLTMGNKKSVDIVVVRSAGDTLTVDVKGLAGKTSWPVDNVKSDKRNHFLAFVCFLGKIENPESLPDVWIIPSSSIGKFTYTSPKGRRVVQLSRLRREAKAYKDAWNLLQ